MCIAISFCQIGTSNYFIDIFSLLKIRLTHTESTQSPDSRFKCPGHVFSQQPITALLNDVGNGLFMFQAGGKGTFSADVYKICIIYAAIR